MKTPLFASIFCCAILFQLESRGQDALGARAAAMSGSALVLEDAWACFHNQAALASVEGFSAGVFYQNRFMLGELSDRGMAAALQVGQGAFGVSYTSFGYNAFLRSKAGLGYGMKLGENFSIGVQANLHSIRISEGYGNRQSVSVEGGFLYKMNQHLHLAFHLFNVNRAPLADFNNEKIPGSFKLGAGYWFSDRVLLSAQVNKPSDSDAYLSSGIEYQFPKNLIVRAGIRTGVESVSFGFGWNFGRWQLDAASVYHQVLGFSPQLSLVFRSKEKP